MSQYFTLPHIIHWTSLYTGLSVILNTKLDSTGLDSTGLDSTGLDWTGLDWTGLPSVFNRKLDSTGLPTVCNTKLDFTGLDWTPLPSPFHMESIMSMEQQIGVVSANIDSMGSTWNC
jgi:hypothetical protein